SCPMLATQCRATSNPCATSWRNSSKSCATSCRRSARPCPMSLTVLVTPCQIDLAVPHSQLGHRPVGSAFVSGLSSPYEYPFSCCGSSAFRTGSGETNRPVTGSYSRAPRCTSPVASVMPPTNPLSPGSVTGVPREPPYGDWYRRVTCCPELAIAISSLPCRSPISQLTPAEVRTARTLPPSE